MMSKVRVFQWLDLVFGGILCGVLTVARWVGRGLFGEGEGGDEGRKGLLFLKLAEQGSTVLAAGAIADAVRACGRERVYFLVFSENRFILDCLRLIPEGNVLEIDTRNLWGMVWSGLRQLWRVRRMRLRYCVDMEFFAKMTACFGFLTGIPNRVGFHSYFGEGPWRGDLMTHRLRYNPHFHTSEAFRMLVAAVQERDRGQFPRFEWRPGKERWVLPRYECRREDAEAMRGLIREATGGRHRAIVLLNPNASDLLPLRRWDDENYLELARRLLDWNEGVYVGFTGGPNEAAKVNGLAARLGSERVFSSAGRTTLHQLLALYELADVLVTNDSGPAHFAGLTGIHTVVLFGPETPALFGSLSERNVALTAGLACSPCVSALNHRQTVCRNNRCMQLISVERVFEAVKGCLEERGVLAGKG